MEKELRIGNWVLYDKGNGFQEVMLCIAADIMLVEENRDKFKPIPLTEQIFYNIGIRDENGDYYIDVKKESDLRFYLVDDFIQLTKFFHAPMWNYEHVKYLHQLQNLYFAITGKELTIKE